MDNIVVDMSFNQIGGLCTLNFLEAMDRMIGNKHLFKRSIILVQAPKLPKYIQVIIDKLSLDKSMVLL